MKDTLSDLYKFIENPSCLWDITTTRALVELKWAALKSQGLFLKPADYSTGGYLSKQIIPEARRLKLDFKSDFDTYLEDYSDKQLGGFYDTNEMVPIGTEQLKTAQYKLNKAIALFNYPGGPLKSINLLVRSIHVLKQDDPEIDMSHSDPQIPFSIFVSVCDDATAISNLRVAESILHEAMHLKLTILENIVPMVKPFDGSLHFSPWRNQKRPAQGVLHGAFVFKAINDFYHGLLKNNVYHPEGQIFLLSRISEITGELNQLQSFGASKDLTSPGISLTTNLLPSN